MALYLTEPDGTRNDFAEDIDTNEERALVVMEMLILEGCEWVEMRSDEDPLLRTRWTVIERDEHGVATRIASEEFDGTVEMLDNSGYPARDSACDEVLVQEAREHFLSLGMTEDETELAIQEWRESGAFDVPGGT